MKVNLIKHIIEEVLQNLNDEIEQKRVKIIFNELDQSSIYCDKSKFVQLLQNLISNAITYSKESVEPIIEIVTVSEPTSFTIQVKDNGIGIDEAHYSTIFEMFKQLKAKAGTQGSGIGFATCKKIVDLHKGIISVESKVNEGSVFSITIPQEIVEEKKKIQKLSQNHIPKLSQAAVI